MRTERYQSLLPIEKLQATACSIIGVGAIGRQVAIQLAAMGAGSLQLVDFDTVDEVNLGPQAYLPEDVGKLKVAATAAFLHRVNPDVRVEAVPERFARSMTLHAVVFSCVDSIQARRHLFNAAAGAACFVDGRMAAEVLRVLCVSSAAERPSYARTLFDPAEAHRAGCTARSTLYCASIAAGLMVAQFTKWLRGFPVEADVSLNVLAMELGAG